MCILGTAMLQAYPLPKQQFISLCESNDAESLRKILEAMPLQERLKWAEGHHGYLPLKTYFHKSEDSLSADFLSVLLDYHCDPEITTGLGACASISPLMLSARLGLSEIVQCLLEHKAKINTYTTTSAFHTNTLPPGVEDTLGWSALHFAVNGGYTKIVELLLAAGADPLASWDVKKKRDYPLSSGDQAGMGCCRSVLPKAWSSPQYPG